MSAGIDKKIFVPDVAANMRDWQMSFASETLGARQFYDMVA